MQRRRSIRTTNEGRSVQVKEEQPTPQPAPAAQPNPYAKQVGKEIVDHLNTNLPPHKPKSAEQSIKELVEKAQKDALSGYHIGKGISKSWVDTQYGGMSEAAYSTMVAKYNQLLMGQVQKQAAASLKPYSGQNYPQSTTISAPPGYENKFAPPPSAFNHPGLDWGALSEAVDVFDTKKEIKIIIDPTLPEDLMVTMGPNGKPIMIQLQKQDAAALKQGSE